CDCLIFGYGARDGSSRWTNAFAVREVRLRTPSPWVTTEGTSRQRAPLPSQAHPSLLVIEDDDDFRAFVADLLRGAGHQVAEAATGSEALARVQAERPSLVVLDVHLPDISGYEVCRELRDQFGDLLPIIFISGERTEMKMI